MSFTSLRTNCTFNRIKKLFFRLITQLRLILNFSNYEKVTSNIKIITLYKIFNMSQNLNKTHKEVNFYGYKLLNGIKTSQVQKTVKQKPSLNEVKLSGNISVPLNVFC